MPGVIAIDYLVEVQIGGIWTAIADADVLDVSGADTTTGNRDNALAFGDSSDARCTISLRRASAPASWERLPVRVQFDVGGVSERAFVGILWSRQRAYGEDSVTFTCVGMREHIATTKSYSRAFSRRPVATKTTATSIDDPANGGYAAGLMNWICWQAGGRPAEQDVSYPNATFYYSFDQAPFAPRWSWVAGEDGWEELLRLARASGGQVYQDRDGVIRYRSPLAYGAGVATYTFDESVYSDVTDDATSDELYTSIVCPYIPREVRPMQQVAEDTEIRTIEANGTLTIEIEPEWPLYDLLLDDAGKLEQDAVVATFLDGRQVAWGTDVTHTVEWQAQYVKIVLTNATPKPVIIWKITLTGMPITAGEPGSVTVGAGTVERTLDENPYVQDATHARRLALLTLAFYDTVRPTYKLRAAYDAARSLFEVVQLTVTEWGVANIRALIVGIEHTDTGATASYDLVPIDDLPVLDDYYRIGTTNYTGQTKKVSY